MFHKTKQKIHPTSGFIARARLVIVAALLLVLAGSFTAYALSHYHPKVVTITDIPTVQTSDTSRISGTTTKITPTTDTATTPSKTVPVTPATTPTPTPVATPAPTPTPTPTPVVTPASSSDVPSLTPTDTQSSSTTTYQSTNWSGYLATSGHFTAVTGTWVAPHAAPTSTTVESGDGTWVGIGGISTSDLIQIGTENTISASGVVSTSGFYELLPAGAVGIYSLVITPGDTISASVTQTAVSQWTVSMTDVTTGKTFSKSLSYSSSLSSAEWIQEDPSYPDGSLVLLDNFGIVPFSNATTTMNATTLSAAASNASKIILVGQGGASGHGGTPSALNGSSFTVQYN